MGNLTGSEVIEIMNDWITEMEEKGITAVSLDELDEKVDGISDTFDSDDCDDSDEDDTCEICALFEKLETVSEKITLLLEKFE